MPPGDPRATGHFRQDRRPVTGRDFGEDPCIEARPEYALDSDGFTDPDLAPGMVYCQAPADARTRRAAIHFAVGKDADVSRVIPFLVRRTHEDRSVHEAQVLIIRMFGWIDVLNGVLDPTPEIDQPCPFRRNEGDVELRSVDVSIVGPPEPEIVTDLPYAGDIDRRVDPLSERRDVLEANPQDAPVRSNLSVRTHEAGRRIDSDLDILASGPQ